ncbi:Outer membrane protein beta-barrel family protein [Soonwooa buanensis]|uniref:Outer membrane protein beta-barrel family protein n=1 Tax=Soonwooa buanensis TaxID=619805 RepID=A0A1T5DQ27_9FLAO|nr:outer membrane beta-barrel protein [Soonwooa buanensis]SKB73774.1 Outer membrane protein beta-barrel family protein [Soonwooa buanensis]
MNRIFTFSFIILSGFFFAQEQQVAQDTIKQSAEIQEVLIKAQRKKQFVDKSVYSFDEEALKKARYANDLLKTLPELQYDPITKSVASTKGGTTLMLINGIEATELQMRSIRPENVVRVEYYDNPPTRWATRADQVVNVITRNPETGYVFGADVSSAVTTGFVDASAYAGYTKAKHNFGLEYNLNLRDYDDRHVTKIYDYQLLGEHYRSELNKIDHFGYTSQDIALRYSNSEIGKYAFQAKLNINLFNYFSNGIGASLFSKANLIEDHSMKQHDEEAYNIPKLDLYYSKNLGKKSEISFNIVGSTYTTRSSQLANEWVTNSGESVFENDMNLKAKQKSIVGEVAYSYDLTVGKLSAGYRITNNSVDNELRNLLGNSNYKVNYLTQYMYSEFAGKKNKWMYRLGLGLTNIHNKSELSVEDNWTITPKLILGYQIKNNQSLRFISSYTPTSPWSAALSSNVNQVAPNIVSRGNPYLKSKQTFHTNIQYTFNNKYFDFTSVVFYNHINKDINQYYTEDIETGGYALTYENSNYTRQIGAQLIGSVKPFGNALLVLKTVISPTSVKVVTNQNKVIKNDYISNNFLISSEYKNFSFQYNFNFPVYTLSGAFLSTNENKSHFFASYKHDNWTFSSGFYWLGMPSRYLTKSLSESLVNYTAKTEIMNNKSMFVLGLSYDFAKGKKNQIDKKLNNDTAPPATF